MAINKQVKVGGAHFRGHVLAVSSAVGPYALIITNTSGAALNGISFTPDVYGAGDTFRLEHRDKTDASGKIIQVLAEGVYNAGAYVATIFDFPSLQKINNQEALKVIYTNTATKALNIYMITEWVGITKTA